MNVFNFFSYEGYNIKLSEVSFVGPLTKVQMEDNGLETERSTFQYFIGSHAILYYHEDPNKVETFRSSLLSALCIDENKGDFSSSESILDYRKVMEPEEPGKHPFD